MKNRINIKNSFILIIIFIMVVLIGWFAVASEPHSVGFNNEDVFTLDSEVSISYAGETTTSTLPAALDSDKGGILTIEKTLTADDIKGNSMAFYVRQSWVKVYFDDELYFADNSDREIPVKLTPGSYWRMFRLPDNAEGKTLKIEIEPFVSRYAGEAPAIYLGNKAAFLYMIIENGMAALILCIPFLLLGFVLIVAGIFASEKIIRIRLCMLGMFAVTTSLWTLLEARITQIFVSDIDIASVVLFSCYYSIPFFAAAYIDTYESFAKNKLMRGMMYLSGAVFIVIQLLQIYGVIYYIDAVFVGHILIGLIIGATFVNYIIRKKRKVAITDEVIYRAMLLLGIFCFIDIARYYISPQIRAVEFSKVGFLVFFFYLGYSVFKQMNESARREFQNEIYKELAFLDTMTSLQNRTAFELKLKMLKSGTDSEPVIITIADMNNLKHINDTYGHQSGDDAITALAKAVSGIFSDCSCYRIGGDEFCIISEGISKEEIEKLIQLLGHQLEEASIGKKYTVSASVGYSVLEENDVDGCFKNADENMYRIKAAEKKSRK